MALRKSVLLIAVAMCFNTMRGMDSVKAQTSLLEKIDFTLRLFASYERCQTNARQCRYFGYNGELMPIVSHVRGVRAGYIMQNAQPARWFGYGYDESSEPVDLIFIEENALGDPTILYRARITNKNGMWYRPLSSCLVEELDVDKAQVIRLANQCERYAMAGSRPSGVYDRWTPPVTSHLAILWQALNDKHYVSVLQLNEIRKRDNIFDLDVNKTEVTL